MAGQDGWPADGGRPHGAGRDEWAHEGRSADEQWAAGGGWPPGAGMPADEGWPADDGFDDDDDMAPYPLTYERDDFDAADSQPAAPPRAALGTVAACGLSRPDSADADPRHGLTDGDRQSRRGRHAGARPPGADAATAGRRPSWTGQDPGLPGEDPADWAAGGTRRGGRRWLIPAGIVVAGAAVGATAVLLTGGHPGARAARAPAAS